ncbi:DNA-dependent RNA polymerase [Pyrus ussuriensis x Pyrus communis]|uniref:DNA-dependent RNA polymerase (Mitochondrion) n=1 Tax=Pyrus ussuriensis x Pyrus communis TaxID=2448454 RepID=A0A5N5GB25_9ROSA|nr:DNA-dependent RNA polymerase [Pyrus ussuriensis x Pyrus communis]
MIPVTKDAAASAYQIISFLLLNKEIAILTNLLPPSQNEESLKIQDLYLNLKDELLVFLRLRLEHNKYTIIESLLTRKLVKYLFMPLIYGKTIRTMIHDIREVYCSLLSYQDSKQMVNLMNLINLIGWFCSVLDKPVLYSIPFFTTVQDYMRSDTAEIWVYDSTTRKRRRRVTLYVE